MTDVRRTGPPRRLEDQTRIGIPIEGDADGIWQRAFHAHLTEAIQRHPQLSGGEFFGKSMTINPDQIKFYFVASPSSLPNYLDMIEAAIPLANQTAAEERERAQATLLEAERNLRDRNDEMERELKAWADKQPATR